MTTHERITRMVQHREADRVPINDIPWAATMDRWIREGYPKGVPLHEYFDYDFVASIGVDNSPRYPWRTIEETDDWVIAESNWGATMKNWKKHGGVPEFLDFKVVDPETWAVAKARMIPTRDRVDWDYLKANYGKWKDQGAWISAGFWFGFDVTHSWFVGTDRVLMALVEDKEWLKEIFNHMLDLDIALYEMIWEAGYRFDEVTWPDDMAYKHHMFFSLDTYREVLKPVQKRACDWAHEHGAVVRLHTDGDVNPMIPELIEIGVEMLNPLEVKAGMHPPTLKKLYGDKLVFHGGLNTALFPEPEKLYAEMEEFIPIMKENGGYWISSDHSVPDSVNLEQFTRFVQLAKKLGSYG
ncbi:MAG TPA: uroporphyrinogen decarboxylase family protein [Fimbriimonas sp.]